MTKLTNCNEPNLNGSLKMEVGLAGPPCLEKKVAWPRNAKVGFVLCRAYELKMAAQLGLGTFFLSQTLGQARPMACRTGPYRYKVNYPTLYASESENKDANLFNCVQRGHQNSLEHMPVYFILMILGGMRHPCICAGLGVVYLISRYFYFTGYSSGDPQKRLSVGYNSFLLHWLLHFFC
ncbi:hypothetical protein KSS87_017559 [Heliosperma pusillum]|nr:hypothetical protein KSS87_017559 [Heliosperma pusillum]